ncbi:vWA domain-containing protein [Flammeovirga agarivorans]|uniref:VWFA domain-containing protein n=1 Tax=Flammeovirga agarivorans TaxID=2726742 RepID=A0A7X8XZ78_9BACT|nr:hypothetical protein [Flammeovirga agarivorans]NLR94921.1 hypothetical protein [Flammeovirga agarivorans]
MEKELATEIKEFEKIVEGKLPETFEEVCEYSRKTFDWIKSKFEDSSDLNNESSSDSSESEGDASSDSSNSSGNKKVSDKGKKSKPSKNPEEESDREGDSESQTEKDRSGDSDETEDSKDGEGGDSDKDSDSKPEGDTSGNGDSFENVVDKSENIKDIVETLGGSPSPTGGDNAEKPKEQKQHIHITFKEYSTIDGVVVVEGKECDNRQYNRAIAEVRGDAQFLSRRLNAVAETREYVRNSQRTGKMDRSKIAEVKAGVSSIYMQKEVVETGVVGVGILVDNSGSMKLEEPGGRTRSDVAKEVALCITKAAQSVPKMEVRVWAHDTAESYHVSGGATLRELYTRGTKTLKKIPQLDPEGSNADADALIKTKKLMEEEFGQNFILILISDGEPTDVSVQLEGKLKTEDAEKALKLSVDKIRKEGIPFIPVLIGPVRAANYLYGNGKFLDFSSGDFYKSFIRFFTKEVSKKLNTY